MNIEAVMGQAIEFAQQSKDPSTQNSAIIWHDNGFYTVGINNFPPGVLGSWERPNKYEWCECAERVAIFLAAQTGESTHDAIMVSPWASCAPCARAIVWSGFKELVRLPFDNDLATRWGSSCLRGDDIMTQGGVKITEIQLSKPVGITLLRDGKELVF